MSSSCFMTGWFHREQCDQMLRQKFRPIFAKIDRKTDTKRLLLILIESKIPNFVYWAQSTSLNTLKSNPSSKKAPTLVTLIKDNLIKRLLSDWWHGLVSKRSIDELIPQVSLTYYSLFDTTNTLHNCCWLLLQLEFDLCRKMPNFKERNDKTLLICST